MKKNVKYILIIALVAMCLVGCSRREIHTIEANQTAFLIPLKGNTEDQASFESEELLSEAKVAAKQVSITYTREKVGPMDYQWVADNMLIVVDRTPVTREWANTTDIGTSTRNQAIYAESMESIGFSVGMNCSAQIYTEDDAVLFLYSYNNKSLEDIMDTEIRARIETDFVEICAQYSMADILRNKKEIMDYIRDDVITYFAERGITITVLGMKDGVEYDDPAVQVAINSEFIANREAAAQAVINETALATARTEADAVIIAAQAEAEANALISESLTDELLTHERNMRWDGHEVPVYNGVTPFVSAGN